MNSPDQQLSLEAHGLTKSYTQGHARIDVLTGAELSLARGERVAIIGPSGSGKSTLLHILAGLDTPDRGKVLVGGTDMASADGDARARARARYMGFVYQNHHLLPEFSALENVAMPLRIAGISASEARAQASQLLQEVGLGERLEHTPSQLSGGERQRVAVARALAGSPLVVLADEPTGNLDSRNARDVMDLISRLSVERGVAFLVVTHDFSMLNYFDRTLELSDGKLRPHQRG